MLPPGLNTFNTGTMKGASFTTKPLTSLACFVPVGRVADLDAERCGGRRGVLEDSHNVLLEGLRHALAALAPLVLVTSGTKITRKPAVFQSLQLAVSSHPLQPMYQPPPPWMSTAPVNQVELEPVAGH
jgi:hypothetical protein